MQDVPDPPHLIASPPLSMSSPGSSIASDLNTPVLSPGPSTAPSSPLFSNMSTEGERDCDLATGYETDSEPSSSAVSIQPPALTPENSLLFGGHAQAACRPCLATSPSVERDATAASHSNSRAAPPSGVVPLPSCENEAAAKHQRHRQLPAADLDESTGPKTALVALQQSLKHNHNRNGSYEASVSSTGRDKLLGLMAPLERHALPVAHRFARKDGFGMTKKATWQESGKSAGAASHGCCDNNNTPRRLRITRTNTVKSMTGIKRRYSTCSDSDVVNVHVTASSMSSSPKSTYSPFTSPKQWFKSLKVSKTRSQTAWS